MTDTLDFSGIKQFVRGALVCDWSSFFSEHQILLTICRFCSFQYEGKFKVHLNGVSFKSDSTGKVDQISPNDILSVKWLKVAYDYELQFLTKSKSVVKYDGFRDEHYDSIKKFLTQNLDISLKKQDMSVKGWNHGAVEFEHDVMSFRNKSDDKPAFEVPLRNVTKCDTPGKNEVRVTLI